jgi:hypothetical protein
MTLDPLKVTLLQACCVEKCHHLRDIEITHHPTAAATQKRRDKMKSSVLIRTSSLWWWNKTKSRLNSGFGTHWAIISFRHAEGKEGKEGKEGEEDD